VLNELDVAGIPVVTVAMGRPRAKALNVRIDDFAAAREMTAHLLELGHRRLGHIKGHPNHIASHERARGFRAAMEDYGVDPDTAPIEQGYFTFRSGLIAAERLLGRNERPTAIFAANDDMAAAAVSVCHRQGLTVPGDISIVGFDDTAPATTVWPELTTVKQPISAMADAALELLLADLRLRRSGQPSEAAERVLEHSLIFRESSAAPAAQRRRAGGRGQA
jgi:LacI family transcriptional regulator